MKYFPYLNAKVKEKGKKKSGFQNHEKERKKANFLGHIYVLST